MFEFLLSFSPCFLWFFSACRLGRWEKWLACLVIHGCILILPYLSFSRILYLPIYVWSMHLHLPHLCLDFVLEKIRISMYFYVLRTHILFSFDHFFFFTVTGMIHYCSMYLSIASKWGQKNESLFLRQKWMRQVFYLYIFCRTCNTTIYFFIYGT